MDGQRIPLNNMSESWRTSQYMRRTYEKDTIEKHRADYPEITKAYDNCKRQSQKLEQIGTELQIQTKALVRHMLKSTQLKTCQVNS